GFALQRRGAGDPVAFGQLAHDLRMGVLGDLADEGLAIGLRHLIPGLDLDPGSDALFKACADRLHAPIIPLLNSQRCGPWRWKPPPDKGVGRCCARTKCAFREHWSATTRPP